MSTATSGSNLPPRNVVICCDGTGNVWKPERSATNIVKLVDRLDLTDTARQLVYYDPGVGTAGDRTEGTNKLADRLARAAGLAWGRGVWQNVAEAYIWLMNNYQPGDQLWLFGFSRGAFTARAVSGLLANYGLLRREHANMVPSLLTNYRTAERGDFPASIRQRFARALASPENFPIHFLGMFDTVESVGMSDILLGASLASNNQVKPGFGHVRHALALDESRWPYAPRSYTPIPNGRSDQLKEVWFAGAHCDVGGGYANCQLSDLVLWWMLEEAETKGLQLHAPLGASESSGGGWRAKLTPHPASVAHDEGAAMPLWTLLGRVRRAAPEAHMHLHQSVLDRAMQNSVFARLHHDVLLRKSGSVEPHSKSLAAAIATETRSPAAERPPTRTSWGLLALIAMAAAIVIAWTMTFAQQSALFDLQRTALGALAQRLDESKLAVSRLLWIDTAFVAVYATAVALISTAVLRLSERFGFSPRRSGELLSRATVALCVGDLAENFLTALSVSLHQDPSVFGFPGPGLAIVAGVLAGIACWIKLVGGFIGVMVAAYVLLRGTVSWFSRPTQATR